MSEVSSFCYRERAQPPSIKTTLLTLLLKKSTIRLFNTQKNLKSNLLFVVVIVLNSKGVYWYCWTTAILAFKHSFFLSIFTTTAMEENIDDIEEDENMKEDEDDEDADDMEQEEDIKASVAKPKGRRKPRSVLTGRGVTLGMLMDDGVIESGEKCLSIDYLVCILYIVTYILLFKVLFIQHSSRVL